MLAWAGITLPGGDAPQVSAPTPADQAEFAPDESAGEHSSVDVGTVDRVPAEERAEVARVLGQIDAGERLPYEQDGATFENREGRLPDQSPGYYREYTVPTPGSPDRGARRLVIGAAGETYYTRDHYGSFERIDPADFR